ncbi:putative exocyst complex component Sec10 [Helianthus debilis subsp. tardiflorus]
MEFNSSQGEDNMMQLSSLFSDDKRVGEVASIAQKLRSLAEEDIGRHATTVPGNAGASKGLEVAITNLQEYCNDMLLLSFEVLLICSGEA